MSDILEELRADYCNCLDDYKQRGRMDPQCESCQTKAMRTEAADELAQLRAKCNNQDEELSVLKARVQELEQLSDNMMADRDEAFMERHAAQQQLAASQLSEKRLREVMGPVIAISDRGHDAWLAAKAALATPTDTAALDAYVAEKVKEAGRDLCHELEGIAADLDAGQPFDAVCRATLGRVIAALQPAKEGE